MKVLKEIGSISDCHKLPQDVEGVFLCFNPNPLVVNGSKSKLISYSRKTSIVNVFINLLRGTCAVCLTIRDLGVISESKLNFCVHFQMISSCAIKTLRMISRITRGFHRPHCFITLFNNVRRLCLEYASVV